VTKEEIMALYEKAKQGDTQAQYEIGELYAAGNGVKQNVQQAALWFGKAAAEGHVLAQERFDELHNAGGGDTQGTDKAAAQNSVKQGGTMKFCGNCGAAIKEGAAFCGSCGAKEGVPGSAVKISVRFGETEQTKLFSIARKAAYISAAILSVLIAVGVVCAFVYSGKTGKQTANTSGGLVAIAQELLGRSAQQYVQPIINQIQTSVEQYINQHILPVIIGFSVLLLFLMFTIMVMLLLLLAIEKNTRNQKGV
jgi:TPR repeat protein